MLRANRTAGTLAPERADALLTGLAPDTWHTPEGAARRFRLRGTADPEQLLREALAAGVLDTDATGALAYAGCCWLPGRLLAPRAADVVLTAPPAPVPPAPARAAPTGTGAAVPPAGPPASSPPAGPSPEPLPEGEGDGLFSYYEGPIRNLTPRASITAGQLHAVLTDPPARLRQLADRVRAEYAAHGKSVRYKALKERLDYVICSGTFAPGLRRVANVLTRSGLLMLDFDGLADVAAARALLLADEVLRPLLVLLFVSPSGAGLKALVNVGTAYPLDRCLCALSERLTAAYGLTPDPVCKDITRACFVGYDPDAWLNPA